MRPILLTKSIIATLFVLFPATYHSHSAYGQILETHPVSTIAGSSASLSPDDCPKCHNEIVLDINTYGQAHKTDITCIDCHQGHPPQKRDIIPRCSKCHQEEPHYNLPDCLVCHTNPHTPLRISLTRDITFPCTTCHEPQIIELTENPSVHTALDCTACHTKHGLLPECFACHAPHMSWMSNQDCHACHKPHMPLVISYNKETPSELCGSCHNDAYITLGQSPAKHRNIACALCHEAKHKMIPKCQKCHDQPHSQSIHDKFNRCGICHGLAHELQLIEVDMLLEKNLITF